MNSNCSIRSARPDDAVTILRFVRELATYEKAPEAVTASADAIREQLASPAPPFECLIAEIDGRPAGFALFFANYSTWLGKPGVYIEDLYVTPELRQQGIGRALVAEIVNKARVRGSGRVEWSVLDWNRPAIDFYRSLGALPLDAWTTFRLSGDALEKFPGEP